MSDNMNAKEMRAAWERKSGGAFKPPVFDGQRPYVMGEKSHVGGAVRRPGDVVMVTAKQVGAHMKPHEQREDRMDDQQFHQFMTMMKQYLEPMAEHAHRQLAILPPIAHGNPSTHSMIAQEMAMRRTVDGRAEKSKGPDGEYLPQPEADTAEVDQKNEDEGYEHREV